LYAKTYFVVLSLSKKTSFHCFVVQSSRHILRSNEIIIPPNGLLDVELDLSFSMQVIRIDHSYITTFV